MIGRLQGKLIEKAPPQILIDVNGVGYEVDVPMSTFCNLPTEGQPLTLLTHMVVREDAQLLYGFATASERQAFRALIRISGIGPRIALAVLSGMSPNVSLTRLNKTTLAYSHESRVLAKKQQSALCSNSRVNSTAQPLRRHQEQQPLTFTTTL